MKGKTWRVMSNQKLIAGTPSLILGKLWIWDLEFETLHIELGL